MVNSKYKISNRSGVCEYLDEREEEGRDGKNGLVLLKKESEKYELKLENNCVVSVVVTWSSLRFVINKDNCSFFLLLIRPVWYRCPNLVLPTSMCLYSH